MDLTVSVHDQAKTTIEMWAKQGESWEDIKSLSFFMPSSSFEEKINAMNSMFLINCEYTRENWKRLVSYVKKFEESNEKVVTKLAEGTKNDAQISQSERSAWQLYKKKLYNKNWNEESIQNVEKSAYEILQMLSQDTEKTEAVKGLVLGHVQSGKTANMAGLIAMAADYGFNYFIVLTGVIDNLRKQTEQRLYDDLSSIGNINWRIIKNPHPTRYNIHGDQMDELNLSSINPEGRRYMSVVLKNSVRLGNLVKYIYSSEAKNKQLKILVIDDEADQASINTRKMDDIASSEEKIERTAINNHITNLVNGYNGRKLKAVNYISYTATPYANVLNESTSYSLYPKDFIISLEPSKNYLGPKEIFGLSEPEINPSLDIVREISLKDTELLRQIHRGEYSQTPKSLMKAIQWFLISSVAMKYNGYKQPVSMLVHTSHIVADHQGVENMIKNYLLHIKKIDPNSFLAECERLYLTETADFTKNDFLAGVPEYTISIEDITDYPKWEIIEKGLRALLARDESEYLTRIRMDEDGRKKYSRGIHLCIDNSRATGSSDEYLRLVYPDKSNDPGFLTMFIVIGGNTLSRGLTLEGLTTSYFMRNTIASDSLMQMGRWFGYRIGYEMYPRIWLNELIKERFGFVSQLDQELRDDIQEFNRLGKTPKEFGVRVKNSPNNAFIQITSKNKMQGAITNTVNFAGIQKQTILFKDDYQTLSNNINITKAFLQELPMPHHKGSRLIWKQVDYEIIKERFFSKYKACEKDIMFNNLSAFMDWCDEVDNQDILRNWSVVLSSKGDLSKASSEENTWAIHGYKVPKISRTVLGNRHSDNKTISIGALRSPRDLLSDIIDLNSEDSKGTKTIEEVRIIREKHGVSNVPQLVIYIIDKESKPNDPNNKRRSPLKFTQDIIGISLMIPGMRNGTNVATSLIVNITLDDENIEVEED